MKLREILISSDDKRFYLLIFVISFILRSIPNLLSPYPIGYDTIDYAAQILDWKNHLSNSDILFQTPLLILVTDAIHILSNANPFLIIKLLQPLLYGFLISSFYYTSRKVFNWEPEWAFIGALVFSLQTVTLRVSWDLLKNELGLAFLLTTLPLIKKSKSKSYFILFSILTVFSHQIPSVILFVILFELLISNIWKKIYDETKQLLLISTPFLLMFILIFNYSGSMSLDLQNNTQSVFVPDIISIPTERSLPFPFVDYLAGEGLADYQGSHISLMIDVFSTYVASYLFLAPFSLLGILNVRKRSIDVWMMVCTFPIVNCLLTPGYAIFSWHRWMLMLVVPYTFFAVVGIIQLKDKVWLKLKSKNILYIVLSIYAVSSIFYLIMPYTTPISLYAALNPSSKYLPTTMMRNTIPLEHVQSVDTAFYWLNQEIEPSSCLLVKDAFIDWAKIFIQKNLTMINYKNKDVSIGLRFAHLHNFTSIYWIWWDNGVGFQWYGQEIHESFSPIYRNTAIVIYRYKYGE